jgi:DNA gyrase subunit A
MATNIPPHNLTEIVNAAIALIQNPHLTISELLKIVPGPDFPTGGYILGRQGIYDAYTRGRGQLKLRPKAATEHVGKDRDQIVITEIPYAVNKARLIEHAAALVGEKKLEGISDIRDESDREGMRIVFELKRGEQPEVVLNNLYKHTQLQTGFGVIMLSIVNGQPRELGIVEVIKRFIDHRIDVVRRRTEYDLRKAREREHILLGFQKALDQLDLVIESIRGSANPKEAREVLMGLRELPERALQEVVVDAAYRFDFSERQAQSIIEMQLQRLTGMERQKILDELADIQRRIGEYLEILGSEKVLRGVIVKELKEVGKEFGNERRTEIIEDTGDLSIEDLVADEDMAVTLTHGGYVKRTAVDTYRRQGRGGKGRIGMGTRQEDFIEQLIIASTHSYVLIFTNLGRLYWLKVYAIPDAGTTGKGKHVSNLINLQPGEEIRAFLAVREFVEDQYIVMVTRRGVIKKSALTEFDNPMSRGIIAIGLDDGDELMGVRMSNGTNCIFLASRNGQAIRFQESDVRPMGRPARGVRAMNLGKDDELVGMEVVGEEGLILSVSEMGYGKRTPLGYYRLTGRGGKGVINMKVTGKTGKVVAVMEVKEDSDIIIITKEGKIIRIESNEIR